MAKGQKRGTEAKENKKTKRIATLASSGIERIPIAPGNLTEMPPLQQPDPLTTMAYCHTPLLLVSIVILNYKAFGTSKLGFSVDHVSLLNGLPCFCHWLGGDICTLGP